jgi:hypothetical protein
LPVEYDASNRALAWLENKRMPQQEQQTQNGRARTYVVVGSIATTLLRVPLWEAAAEEIKIEISKNERPDSVLQAVGFVLQLNLTVNLV